MHKTWFIRDGMRTRAGTALDAPVSASEGASMDKKSQSTEVVEPEEELEDFEETDIEYEDPFEDDVLTDDAA